MKNHNVMLTHNQISGECLNISINFRAKKVYLRLTVNAMDMIWIPESILGLPDLILVMVAGKSSMEGLWVVIPTSIDPDHLSTKTSKRI